MGGTAGSARQARPPGRWPGPPEATLSWATKTPFPSRWVGRHHPFHHVLEPGESRGAEIRAWVPAERSAKRTAAPLGRRGRDAGPKSPSAGTASGGQLARGTTTPRHHHPRHRLGRGARHRGDTWATEVGLGSPPAGKRCSYRDRIRGERVESGELEAGSRRREACGRVGDLRERKRPQPLLMGAAPHRRRLQRSPGTCPLGNPGSRGRPEASPVDRGPRATRGG